MTQSVPALKQQQPAANGEHQRQGGSFVAVADASGSDPALRAALLARLRFRRSLHQVCYLVSLSLPWKLPGLAGLVGVLSAPFNVWVWGQLLSRHP